MNKYEHIYIIKDNSDVEDIYKTAMNRRVDGGLVLVIIEGKYINITDKRFDEGITVLVENDSECIFFDNCTFESESVLVENNGMRVFFNKCVFIGGDTFIKNAGYAVFSECRFVCSKNENVLISGMVDEALVGSLIYSVILDSEIEFTNSESMAFITDGDVSTTLINTKMIGSDSNVVIWTKDMVNENTFSYYNCGYICGADECGYKISERGLEAYTIWNLLSGTDNWNPLGLEEEYKTDEKKVFFITTRKNISFTAEGESKIIELTYYPKEAEFGYGCNTENFVSVIEKYNEGNRIYLEVNGKNDSEESVYGFITFITSNDIKTDCVAEIKPSIIEPPRFLSTPVVLIKDGRAIISYELDLNGREDQSEISWYRVDNIDRTKLVAIREFKRSNERDCRKIAVSRNEPCREIVLTSYDIGRHIKVNIKPKHSRSNQGPGLNVMSRIVMFSDVKTSNIVINLKNQVLNPYYKSEPGYGTATGIWFYKKIPGCRHYGMVTESGDCGFYFDGDEKYDDMTVYIILDMENNNGEGFNNKGEYQEIYIKYDSIKRCGYGLRYECVDAKEHIAGFSLYRYDGIQAHPISDMVMGCYMKSGMDIKLDIIKNKFTAAITVPDIKDTIELSANVEGNRYSGMGIKNNVVSTENARIGIRHIEMSYPDSM